RRAHRAALRLAVPAAVSELFAQESIDESIAALAEIRAQRDHAAVDAGFDLALEEGRVSKLRSPCDAVTHEIDGRTRTRAFWVESQVADKQERVHVRPPERRTDPIAPLA